MVINYNGKKVVDGKVTEIAFFDKLHEKVFAKSQAAV